MNLRPLAALMLCLGLTIWCLPAGVYATPAQLSGSFNVTFPGSQGTSSYSIIWSYPASVESGKTLNVSATLYVNGLTGLKLFVDTYSMSAFVGLAGKGFVGEGNVTSSYGCGRPMGCGSPHIYPGEHWGPENISLPIQSKLIATTGNSTATVSIGFVTSVWFDAPVSLDYQEYGSKVVGNLTIVSSQGAASPGSFLSFLGFVAFGGFLGPVVLYVFMRRTGRSTATRKDSPSQG